MQSLRTGQKSGGVLAEHASVPESEVLDRLSYLIAHGFINEESDGGKRILSADTEKLTGIIEDGDNFDGAISGLEKMDSYLN